MRTRNTLRGRTKIAVSFTGKNLTHFGGAFLFREFFKALGVAEVLEANVRFPRRVRHYETSDAIFALLYAIIVGIGRIGSTRILRQNGAFQRLISVRQYPTAATLRRFLARFHITASRGLVRAHDTLLRRVQGVERGRQRRLLDLDSTVLTVYGHQQGARIGYNPRKRGRPSYHPLVGFEGMSRDCLGGTFRRGDVHTAHGALRFLRHCLARLPATSRPVLVRGDAGFYDRVIIEALDGLGAQYAIVAKITAPVRARLPGLSYQRFYRGFQAAEFQYRPARWRTEHRFVVVRKPLPEEPSSQLQLFPAAPYGYQVLVSNLRFRPETVWRLYNGRANAENLIKEIKAEFHLAKIPTRSFAANRAYFHLLLLAYNLVNWFKRLCLPPEHRNDTVRSLRTKFIVLPGRLVRIARRQILKLPEHYPYAQAFLYAMDRITRLRFDA